MSLPKGWSKWDLVPTACLWAIIFMLLGFGLWKVFA